MKTIKPDTVSILPRIMELPKQSIFIATALIGFTLDNPAVIREDADIWQAAGQALGEDQALDAGYIKSKSEILLVGTCRAFPGQPVQTAKVRLSFGKIDKTLTVMGDRYWKNWPKNPKPSEPSPFVSMPLDYTHAFGGPDFPPNPLGKGLTPVINQEGAEVHPLPNIESPGHRITSPEDRPAPVGFAPLDPTWPQRSSHTGTYDAKWLKEDWPNFPSNMDMSYFNTAPADQRLNDWPLGNESFILEGVHSKRPVIESRLPAKKPRIFITTVPLSQKDFSEISLHIDTVWFFPDQNIGVIAFRGSLPLQGNDSEELIQIYAALEDLDAPGSVPEHYQAFLSQISPPPTSTEQDNAASPPEEPLEEPEDETLLEEEAAPTLSPEEKAALQELEDKIKAAEKNLADELAKQGLNYEEIIKARQAALDASAVPPEISMEEAEALMVKACQEMGIDPAQLAKVPPPPVDQFQFDPTAVIASLSQAGLLNPEVENTIWNLDRKLKSLPEKIANLEKAEKDKKRKKEAASLPALTLDRETFLRQYAEGRRDYSGQDLSGIDLSGTEIANINLNGAILSKADFTGCVLRGAKIKNADAAESLWDKADLRAADLSGSNFSKARLAGVNAAGCEAGQTDFTEAVLNDACFKNADFEEAVLIAADMSGAELTQANLKNLVGSGAVFRKASFYKACLDQADLSGAMMNEANLSEVQAIQADFSEADLTGTKFLKANLDGASLDKSLLSGADFSKAHAVALSLHGANGEETKFSFADLENLRTDSYTALPRADFSHSRLELAYFGGSNLAETDFSLACLDQATFQNCRLRRANFYRASAKEGRFIKCDLTEAKLTSLNLLFGSLAKSNCVRTDFRGSNLFGVDTLKTVFSETNILGANLKRSRLQEQVTNDQG
ncbi:MAG: DUF2169 domain-containing protein [Deltaproteobacteria bacterium]|nr:DUF2169 domain-containing protein [Deltaproteobacteria bacterium]